MNEEEVFNSIKSKIDLINQQVYSKYDIAQIKRRKKKVEKINKFEGDLVLLENRMSKQKPIGKPTIDKMKKYESTMLNIEEEIQVEKKEDENKELISWKNLDVDVKLIKFDEYMKTTSYNNFPQKLSDKLIQMIKDEKLDKKKYIIYNEESEKIYDIPVINYDSNLQEYYLRCDRENKKKKISKIFK